MSSYEVAECLCIPPNAPSRHTPEHDAFTVIGASETGMDAIILLLGRGVNPANIIWVRPNDYWLFQRENIMNHRDYSEIAITTFLAEMTALGTVSTIRGYCEKMEQSGMWHRIDPDVWPTKFNAFVRSRTEIDQPAHGHKF
jgi:hypothetical protein